MTKEQKKQYNKTYRENHRDEINAKRREYYQSHKEKVAKAHKEYYSKNKDKLKEYSKKYQSTHKEQYNEYMKNYMNDYRATNEEYNINQSRYIRQWRYCDNLSDVTNYDKAKADSFKGWELHHLLEETYTSTQLMEMDMYYHRPANEFIFLTRAEHKQLHKEINKARKEQH